MSDWIQGELGPDLTDVLYETITLAMRIGIGSYGSYGLMACVVRIVDQKNL